MDTAEVSSICCIGAGYVGGPTAAVMAYYNPHLTVTVVDRDQARIDRWNSENLPLYEPGLLQMLQSARDGSTEDMEHQQMATVSPQSERRRPNLLFSTDVAKNIGAADMILIAVNTPTKKRGLGAGRATDVTALEAVTKQIAIHAKAGAILVEKSTVPCRTADLIRETLKTYRPGVHFEVLSNPEFLSAGTAISDLVSPSRVLIGSQPTTEGLRAATALERVYSWVDPCKIMHTNTYSSELAKLVANAMLAQRISSINSISAICEKTGADIHEISNAIGADARIGSKYLKAGVGFGGSCFGKDIRSLAYLAETLGLPEVAEYWQQVLKINEWQGTRFARKVVKRLNGTLSGKKITVLGYAFKPGTDDTRESPALEGIRILLDDAPAEVAIFDPFCCPTVVREEVGRLCGSEVLKCNDGSVEVYENAYEACDRSHAIIIMTDCDEFRQSAKAGYEVSNLENRLDWPKIVYNLEKPRWVFDGRGIVDLDVMEKVGVRVEGIGRVGWGGL
ncbi:udp-glucose 6-dehydrogenase [Calycina marina]|uniref:UDP-glucose 6-dehydrogenase n=1 Tax=Calycina marina TaxID=1763456 RepID=A0A9P7YZ27_9HELO|nr:udp-glucose 6-dehydrogenase [Calycina marina]